MKFFKLLIGLLFPVLSLAQTTDATTYSDISGKIAGKPYSPTSMVTLLTDLNSGKISRVEANSTSGTNTYTATVSWITAYQTGLFVPIQFGNINSGASTINFNSLGAKSIVSDKAGTALVGGELKGAAILWYDGTNFELMSGSGGTVSSAALTKVDDTNVTLTLGGSPSTALLNATSLTLGWTGTLADARITSASTWNAKVGPTRNINTTSPLSGGGDLSADRTLSIANAVADGSTLGAASFTASDFNSSSGNISIDYTNGQAANGSVKGFLASSDWTNFNTAYNRSGTGLTFSSSTFTFTKQDASTLTVSVPTFNQNTTGTASAWTTGRTLSITGDLAYTSPSLDGSGNVTAAGILATVNSNVGTFGSATKSIVATVNGKGLGTAFSEVTITPAVGSITGLGTGVGTWLATPSSANLASALTDETGTGAVVFAGSPAFTGTPTLGTLGYSDTGILWSMQSSTNSYNQLVLQNTSAGASASTNLIISSDNGTPTTHYIEIGKNSSGFSNGAGSFNIANASYVDDASDDLVIGTLANKTLHFVTNGSTTDALSISGASLFTFTAPTPSNVFTSTWTATANNQSVFDITGTQTSRNNNGDNINGLVIDPTQVRNAGNPTGQTANTLLVNGNFSNSFATQNILKLQNSGSDRWAINTDGSVTHSLGVNNITGLLMKRFTDTSPTGKFLDLQAASGSSLCSIGIDGSFTTIQGFNTNLVSATSSSSTLGLNGGNGTTNAVVVTASGNFITAGSTRNLLNLFQDAAKGFAYTSGTNRGTGLKIMPLINNSGGTNTVVLMDIQDTETSMTGTTLYGITEQTTSGLNGFGTGTPTARMHVVGATKLDGNVTLVSAGNKFFITEGSNGSVGQTALVSGTKAITVTGTTTSTRCFATLVTQGGTVTTTTAYGCACTSNTVTITALTSSATTNTSDTSIVNYWIVN